MILEALAQYLEEKNLGTRHQTIFCHHLPENALSGILLREALTGIAIDHEIPRYRKGDIIAVVRDPNFQNGEALAKSVCDSLTLFGKQLSGAFVNHLLPETEPIYFQKGEGGIMEWSTRFNANYWF